MGGVRVTVCDGRRAVNRVVRGCGEGGKGAAIARAGGMLLAHEADIAQLE